MTVSPSCLRRPSVLHSAWRPGRHTCDARHPANRGRNLLCYGRTGENPPKHLQTLLHNPETLFTLFPHKNMFISINPTCYSNNLTPETILNSYFGNLNFMSKLIYMNKQHMTLSLQKQYTKLQSKYGIRRNFNKLFII